MAFLDLLFPETIALGMTGGPRFATTMAPSPSGDEAIMGHWALELGAWELAQRNRTDAETITLLSLFHLTKGRAHGFKLHDSTDDTGTNELLGTGDGADVTFQLVKHYPEGAYTYSRTILKPLAGVTAALNGTPTVGFTANLATGVLTFAPAPGVGVLVTASFTYVVPVRFDIDACDIEAVNPGAWTWGNIRLVELNAASGALS